MKTNAVFRTNAQRFAFFETRSTTDAKRDIFRHAVLTSDIKKALEMAIDMESAAAAYYTQLSLNTKFEDAEV